MCAFDVLTVYVWYQKSIVVCPIWRRWPNTAGKNDQQNKLTHADAKPCLLFCNTSHLMRGLSAIVKKFLALKMNVYIFFLPNCKNTFTISPTSKSELYDLCNCSKENNIYFYDAYMFELFPINHKYFFVMTIEFEWYSYSSSFDESDLTQLVKFLSLVHSVTDYWNQW